MSPSNRQKKNDESELQRRDNGEMKKTKHESGFKKAFETRSKTWDGYCPQNSENTSNECTVCVNQDDLSSGAFQ